ncbi:MAG: pyridoxal phosphate-dependent aminotransferase, partial [Candidatus Hydrogenedentota bacterium]
MKTLLEEWSDGVPSPLAKAVEAKRQRGVPIVDLITANPHEHGIEFPADRLEQIMIEATRAARIYRPDPRGQLAAREAVAAYHGGVAPDQVVLTCGTSMAYWYVFRLLARPGGNVLCPTPTYPLFDDLARAAGLNVRSYHLSRGPGGAWHIDTEEVEFQITPRTVALVIVSPHNPTGQVASASELARVAEIATRHRLPVVFDEVFREFLHTAAEVPRPGSYSLPFAITLNGVSKMFALPQLKAGWMVVEGSDSVLVNKFLTALEYLSDTFLPVNEMVQAALPRLLSPRGFSEVARLAAMYRQRMESLIQAWRAHGIPVAMPDGGVYAIVPLP